MIAAINAERIKLTSTRSPYWCVGIVVVLGLLLAWLMSYGSDDFDENNRDFLYLVGVNQFGIAVLMIMAVLGITTEYRFGTIRPTFAAVPQRWQVLAAKAAVFAAVAFVVVAILSFLGLVLAQTISGNGSLGDSGALRQMWGTPVVAALSVLIAIAIGALLRHTAGAVALLLVWFLLLENILSLLPEVGEHITSFMPFLNATHFLSETDNTNFHWGAYGGLAYFAVFAFVIFGIAVAVVDSRDA